MSQINLSLNNFFKSTYYVSYPKIFIDTFNIVCVATIYFLLNTMLELY